MRTKITFLGMIVASFFLMNSLKAQNFDQGPGGGGLIGPGGNNGNTPEQITICHLPPGNPENCQQITISVNALQTHLNHGDKLFCYFEDKLPHYLDLVDHDHTKIIVMFHKDGF